MCGSGVSDQYVCVTGVNPVGLSHRDTVEWAEAITSDV